MENKISASFFLQLGILTKRLILRVIRRPLAELPNIFISAFFLFVYDGALGGVFGGSAAGTPFDFAKGNFVNFILPVSIVSASVSGGASGVYLVEDTHTSYAKDFQDRDDQLTFIEYAKVLSDELNDWYRIKDYKLYKQKIDHVNVSYWAKFIYKVCFYNSIVSIEKRQSEIPFSEIR